MIKSLAIVASLIFGMAFCAVSCQEEPVTGPAEFSIVDTNVEVPAEGGEFSVTYSLENPVLGEEIVPTCQDSWVSGFHTLKAYEITFTVTENMTGTPREAVVNVEYNGDTYSFTISQGAYAKPGRVCDINGGRRIPDCTILWYGTRIRDSGKLFYYPHQQS